MLRSLTIGILGSLLASAGAAGDVNSAAGRIARGGPFTEKPPTARTQKPLLAPSWENVALAVPRKRAGCGSQGSAIIVTDGFYPQLQPIVWRGSLKCASSNASQCPMTRVQYGTANWPTVSIAGFSDDIAGASDKQITRLADGTLLLLHQGIRRDAGTTADCSTPEGTCRGAEYFFHSTDCGANWRLVSVLDPATSGPANDPDRYFNRRTQAGHDRPELYADPFNPGRVYMTVLGIGETFGGVVLYRSDDRGVTWRHIAELSQIWTGAYMTSLPNGRLFIVGWFGAGPPHQFTLRSYDPATEAISEPRSVGADLARTPGTRMAAGSEGISRIGSFPDGDYLRMHNTYRTDTGDYGLVVRVVRVSGSTTNVVREDRYVPPSGTSVVGPSVIETDRLEWVPGEADDPAFIYWYETRTAGNNSDFGPARVVGQRFDGTVPGDIYCLSLDGTSCRTWTIFTDVYGDYHRGAFWYDRKKRQLGFLAIWAEQDTAGNGSVRTNVLGLVRSGN